MKLRLILLLIPIEAFSNTRVTIKSISGRSYNDQVTPELIWKKNADNANVLYLGVKLKGLPEVPSAAKLKSGTWNKENKNEFEVYLESQVDTMASKDSSGISKFSFQAQSELSEPIETGCEGFGFKLSKQFSENIPFFLGMSCEKSSDKETKVTLSAPKEAEWGETDLFESQGKGER